jgi:hypothetical protein
VHGEHDDVLERAVRLLDLVVHREVMLSEAGVAALVTMLAVVAGFSQLFSP